MVNYLKGPERVQGSHVRVVSEEGGEGARIITLSLRDPGDSEKNVAHLRMRDFGKFVYIAGVRTEEEARGQGIVSRFLDSVERYLNDAQPPKFALVNNQVSHANKARNMYKERPGWHSISEQNWVLYVPKALRGEDGTVPLSSDELQEMLRRCR